MMADLYVLVYVVIQCGHNLALILVSIICGSGLETEPPFSFVDVILKRQ